MNSYQLSFDSAHSVPSRGRNLGLAALFTVSAMVGIAWWGERSHFLQMPRVAEPPPTTVDFHLPPEPPDPVEDQDIAAKAKVDVAAPELPDNPVKPINTSFIVPIEPPRPTSDFSMSRIPPGSSGTDTGIHVLNISQLDQGPIATYQHKPVYPQDMKREGLSGEVLVDFIVDPKGNVRGARAVRSTHQGFEDAACAAVSRWKFEPGQKDLHPVYVHMQVPIVFSLSQE
jgi:periplasmic protein TonB